MVEKTLFLCERKPQLSLVFQERKGFSPIDGSLVVNTLYRVGFVQGPYGVGEFSTDDPKLIGLLREHVMFKSGVITVGINGEKARKKRNDNGKVIVKQGAIGTTEEGVEAPEAPSDKPKPTRAVKVPARASAE